MHEQSHFVDFRRPMVVSTKILRVLGVWSERKTTFFGLDFYTAYSLLILVACNLECFVEILYWCLEPFDFEKFVSTGVLIFVKLQTNIKVLCIVNNHSMVKRLLNECNEKIFQPKSKDQATRAKNLLKLYKGVYVSYGVIVSCSAILFSTAPLIQNSEEKLLTYLVWLPYNWKSCFWPTFGYQLVTGVLVAETHANIDCFSIGLLAIIIAQCDILKDSLTNLKCKAETLLKASQRRGHNHEEDVFQIEKKLYNCILHHKAILRWFREIQNMLSLLIATQYATTTLSICLSLFQASITDACDPHFAATLVYVTSIFAELLLLCWWENEVTSKSSEIPMAAFQCDWPEMSKKTRSDLLTFIHCTQTPLELFGAGYFKLSLENFLLILNNSYSYFTVLRTVKA